MMSDTDYPVAMKRDVDTIAELQKRIEELEEQRKEADSILRYGLCVLGIAKAAEAYFARYPSELDNPLKVAG
jgi:hypothetical protein